MKVIVLERFLLLSNGKCPETAEEATETIRTCKNFFQSMNGLNIIKESFSRLDQSLAMSRIFPDDLYQLLKTRVLSRYHDNPEVYNKKLTLLICAPVGSFTSSWINYFHVAYSLHERTGINILFFDIPDHRLNAVCWAETLGEVLPIILPRLNITALQVLGLGSGAGAWLKSGLACNPIFQSGTNILVDPQLVGTTEHETDCAIVCMWSSEERLVGFRDVRNIKIDKGHLYLDLSSTFYRATESWLNQVIATLLASHLDWVSPESLISFIEKNPLTGRDLSESRKSRLHALISSVL